MQHIWLMPAWLKRTLSGVKIVLKLENTLMTESSILDLKIPGRSGLGVAATLLRIAELDTTHRVQKQTTAFAVRDAELVTRHKHAHVPHHTALIAGEVA